MLTTAYVHLSVKDHANKRTVQTKPLQEYTFGLSVLWQATKSDWCSLLHDGPTVSAESTRWVRSSAESHHQALQEMHMIGTLYKHSVNSGGKENVSNTARCRILCRHLVLRPGWATVWKRTTQSRGSAGFHVCTLEKKRQDSGSSVIWGKFKFICFLSLTFFSAVSPRVFVPSAILP